MDSFPNNITLSNQGLVEYDVIGYELSSPHSWISFGKAPGSQVYTIYLIATNPKDRNKGHAKELLDVFFRMVKKTNGAVEIESYTAAGEIYIRHIVDKMGQKHGVRILK